MRIRKIAAAVLIGFMAQFMSDIAPAQSVWQPTNGPYGGWILRIVGSGDTLLAGTNIGVFMSTNGGTSWMQQSTGMAVNPYPGIFDLCFRDSTIYAACGGYGAGVYRSPSSNINWTLFNTGLGNLHVVSLEQKDDYLFAGVDGGGGVYRSVSGGAWAASGLPGISVWDLAVVDTLIFAAARIHGVYRSTNNGQTWTPQNNGLSGFDVRTLGVVGDTLFLGTLGNGVFRTTDDGATWQASGLSNQRIRQLFASNGILYAATNFGISRSEDNGATWSDLSSNLTYRDHYTVYASGSSICLGGFLGGGIFVSTNGGASWQQSNQGLRNLAVWDILCSNGSVIAATWGDGVFRSSDGGNTWSNTMTGMTTKTTCLEEGGGFIFAGGDSGYFHRSEDQGSTWSLKNLGLPTSLAHMVQYIDGRLYVSTDQGLYASDDLAGSWYPMNNGLSNMYTRGVAKIDSTLLVGTYGGGVYRSTNGGSQWFSSSTGLSNLNVMKLEAFQDTAFAATWGGRVFKSTNQGSSWIYIGSGLGSGNMYDLITSEDGLYASVNGPGVFTRAFGASTWTSLSTGLSATPIIALASDGSTLYAGEYWGSLFKLDVTTSIDDTRPVPQAFKLWPNAPNPFNPSTTIRYEVPVAGHARLHVYNLLGQQVRTLVDGRQSAGTHEVTWDGKDDAGRAVASGVYLYRLEAGGFIQSRKMLLIK